MATYGRHRPIEEIGHGDHACLAFADDAEQRLLVTAYLRRGLERGERVLYFADETPPDEVADWLREAGVQPEPPLRSGQLTITTAERSYLSSGSFDPAAMTAALHREVAAALAAGYPGFRVSGEMGWALRGVPGADRLGAYETAVQGVFAGRRASAVCQYDARRFDAAALGGVDHRHPLAVEPQALYASGTLRLTEAFRDGRRTLRVAGEVDRGSCEPLARALETAATRPGDVTLDLSDLEFIDLAGLRVLVDTATRLAPDRRLHLLDLAPRLCHVIRVVGWDEVLSLPAPSPRA